LIDVIGKTCPYCQTPIKPGEAVAFCSACSIPHHRECWNEGGGCTTFGCNGNPTAEPFSRHGRNTIDIDINELDSSSIPAGAEFRPDYYEILQVDRHASPEVITAAYRQLLSIYNSEQDGNKQMIKLIQEAYGVLGDSQDRWLYDSWLDNNSPLVENALSTMQPNIMGTDMHITKKRLSVIAILKFGFEILIKHWFILLFILVLTLLSSIINLPFTGYIYANPESAIRTLLLMLIISLPIISLVLSVFVRIILNMLDNRTIEFRNLTSVRIIINVSIYSVMYLIITMVGYILLIVPGVIFSIRLLLGFYLIVDENLHAFEAMKKSWAITRGYSWKIFWYLVLICIFSLILGLTLKHWFVYICAASIFSVIYWFATVFLYRTILSQWQSNVGPIEDMRYNALNYNFPMLNNFIIAVMVIIIIVSSIIYAKIGKPSFEDMYQPDFQYSSINHNDYLSYLDTYSDTQIPLPLPPVSTDMNRISIPEIGNIDIPDSMEIQNQADRQSVEAYRKAVDLPPSNYKGVIFRQKDKDKYSCILVNTYPGEPGDFFKLSEHFTLSEKELSVLSQQMRNFIQKQIEENPGMKMLEWYPPKVEIINGMTAVIFSYRRQLADRPPVLVRTYEFKNYDRAIALTISYRETEKQYWEPLFKRSLDSFRITNIIDIGNGE